MDSGTLIERLLVTGLLVLVAIFAIFYVLSLVIPLH